MSTVTFDVLRHIRNQLDWCGPTGRRMAHIVLTREEAEAVLANLQRAANLEPIGLESPTNQE
jgi:hypothetical protein